MRLDATKSSAERDCCEPCNGEKNKELFAIKFKLVFTG